MKPKHPVHSSYKKLIPGLLITILAMTVLIMVPDWNEVFLSFYIFPTRSLVTAILLFFLALGARTLAWRTFLCNQVNILDTMLALNQGYLLNNVFPFRLGEIGRALLFGRKTGLGTTHVFSTILIERAFDLIFAAGFLIGTIPFVAGADWANNLALPTFVIVLTGLIVLYWIARSPDRVSEWITKVLNPNLKLTRFALPHIDGLLRGLEALSNARYFLVGAGWMSVSWMFGVLEYYVLLPMLEPTAKLWWPVFILGIMALGVALPSAPASLGIFEATMVGGLAILGVNPSASLAYAFIMHFIYLGFTTVIGLYAFSKDGTTLSGVYETIRSMKK